ncbi:phage distal tail protein [Curtobacterium sp. PhB172]|uniref:phage distal tail protein n=1 Tax=Curtobacterium sp. PhB172 TaxID=2485196 RepID=UPI00160B5230|nr:phage tail domain-containing protein [Curtobacterium sp. PhB172]
MYWLESMDGQTVIPLNVDAERILMPGVTGLYLPPVDVVTATTPGIPGSWIQEENILEREVFLPMKFASDESQAAFFAELDELRGMLTTNWFAPRVGATGAFRLGVLSSKGERLLDVTYKSGMEGAGGGADGGTRWQKFGLTLVAADPFFHAREKTSQTFTVQDGEIFLGNGTGIAPWPRALTPAVVIGNGMQIVVQGDVPAWMDMDVSGPATLASVTFPGTNVVMNSAIPAGSQLQLVTDPRRRSARLDGAVAWSKIAFTSTFSPLMPGGNVMDVALNSSGDGTSMTVSWWERFVSAW